MGRIWIWILGGNRDWARGARAERSSMESNDRFQLSVQKADVTQYPGSKSCVHLQVPNVKTASNPWKNVPDTSFWRWSIDSPLWIYFYSKSQEGCQTCNSTRQIRPSRSNLYRYRSLMYDFSLDRSERTCCFLLSIVYMFDHRSNAMRDRWKSSSRCSSVDSKLSEFIRSDHPPLQKDTQALVHVLFIQSIPSDDHKYDTTRGAS